MTSEINWELWRKQQFVVALGKYAGRFRKPRKHRNTRGSRHWQTRP